MPNLLFLKSPVIIRSVVLYVNSIFLYYTKLTLSRSNKIIQY